MDLEDITLSEINQPQKDRSDLVKFTGTECRMVRRKKRELFKGSR